MLCSHCGDSSTISAVQGRCHNISAKICLCHMCYGIITYYFLCTHHLWAEIKSVVFFPVWIVPIVRERAGKWLTDCAKMRGSRSLQSLSAPQHHVSFFVSRPFSFSDSFQWLSFAATLAQKSVPPLSLRNPFPHRPAYPSLTAPAPTATPYPSRPSFPPPFWNRPSCAGLHFYQSIPKYINTKASVYRSRGSEQISELSGQTTVNRSEASF